MLTQQFEWFLNGTNQNAQKIEITLDSETVQRIINFMYQQHPDEKGICETCKHFEQCITKLYESDCSEYSANLTKS